MLSKRLFGIFIALTTTVSASQALGDMPTAPTQLRQASAVKTDAAPSIGWVESKQPVQAVILCIHGLGLHKGTFEAFGKEMAKIGVPTYAIDIRGFGDWKAEDPKNRINFEGALTDIKQELLSLKEEYPDKPIIILGESMGGAIALRATAMYPNLISGLISSVPAGDRFHKTDTELKVGFKVLMGGYNKPMNVGKGVVEQATKKEELREKWENDPLARMQLTPHELMQFQSFMRKNFVVAKEIKSVPVLFIQGANDKLVRPAGTWQLCESLSTPNRQLVLSKNSEHLIFEEGQFGKEDLSFVEKWISKNVSSLGAVAIASDIAQPSVASTPQSTVDSPSQQIGGTINSKGDQVSTVEQSVVMSKSEHPPAGTQLGGKNARLSYWIELFRNGKVYRCNNKTSFRSGDAIRFHIIPQTNCYAYVVMKQSSTGKSSALFPTTETGMNNFILQGKDYPLPSKTWLKFDATPGVEKVSLLLSAARIDPTKAIEEAHSLTAYISAEQSGAKDLVPTRMQLSWDDPTPIIIPEDFAQSSQVSTSNTSLVKLSASSQGGVMAVDVALAHQ